MNEDLLITKVVNLEADMKDVKEKLKKLDTIEQNMDTLMKGQDLMVKILQDHRQEDAAANQRIKRLEEDMGRVKMKLGMATG